MTELALREMCIRDSVILVLVLLALSGPALLAQTELRGIVVQSDDGTRVDVYKRQLYTYADGYWW